MAYFPIALSEHIDIALTVLDVPFRRLSLIKSLLLPRLLNTTIQKLSPYSNLFPVPYSVPGSLSPDSVPYLQIQFLISIFSSLSPDSVPYLQIQFLISRFSSLFSRRIKNGYKMKQIADKYERE